MPDSIAEAARQILEAGKLYDAGVAVASDLARVRVAMLGAMVCYQAILDLAGDNLLARKVLDACQVALKDAMSKRSTDAMQGLDELWRILDSEDLEN